MGSEKIARLHLIFHMIFLTLILSLQTPPYTYHVATNYLRSLLLYASFAAQLRIQNTANISNLLWQLLTTGSEA